jgi:hypothetical protein
LLKTPSAKGRAPANPSRFVSSTMAVIRSFPETPRGERSLALDRSPTAASLLHQLCLGFALLAEREGFEPSIHFLGVCSLSRGVPSTTRPSLRSSARLYLSASRVVKQLSLRNPWLTDSCCEFTPNFASTVRVALNPVNVPFTPPWALARARRRDAALAPPAPDIFRRSPLRS